MEFLISVRIERLKICKGIANMDVRPNPPGRPEGTDKKLTHDVSLKIADAFNKTLIVKHASLIAGETPYHVRRWLAEGQADAQNCIDSDSAQLFFLVGKTLSEKVAEYIERIERCPDNYRAITWLLEKGFREDFGADSDQIKELLGIVSQLHQIYVGKGVLNASKQMDREDELQAGEEG